MPNPRVELPAALAAALREQAREAIPRECCGLLEGARDTDGFTIHALHPARNLADGFERFEIDPRDHIAAVKTARQNGRAIIGCYHSHPGGEPQPSATDLAGAGEDDFLWLIAAGETLAAFLYRMGGFVDADLQQVGQAEKDKRDFHA